LAEFEERKRMSPCLQFPQSLDQSLLDATDAFLREQIAPQAEQLDQNPVALQSAFQLLGNRHWLTLLVPQHWQGRGVNELTFRVFQEQVARYSGALAFLQTQHQSAASRIAQSNNQALKHCLSDMATGQQRIGLGFSQLRRQGVPPVTATPVADGYLLNGAIPWITGFGCFHQFIVGAALPDGRAVFGLMPLQNATQARGGTVEFSEPLALAAIGSTQTVTAQLTDWGLTGDRVLDLKPAGWIHESDRRNVLHHGFFALGCAQAGLDLVERADVPGAAVAGLSLQAELADCRQAMYHAQAMQDTGMHQLHLRAWSIELAVRCAHAAVTVSRGAANYASHPAQRVYREALAFTVFGQTPAILEATLARLTQPGYP
jgi:alkylation response protein AidB-like acyl-CoA dehydrogenase